jgi:hypothetical protein
LVERLHRAVTIAFGRLPARQSETRRDHAVVGAPHRVVEPALVGVACQFGRRGERELGSQLTGQGVQDLGEMLCSRLVVGCQHLRDGAEPDEPPAPADPLGQIVELAGGLGDIAEVE